MQNVRFFSSTTGVTFTPKNTTNTSHTVRNSILTCTFINLTNLINKHIHIHDFSSYANKHHAPTMHWNANAMSLKGVV